MPEKRLSVLFISPKGDFFSSNPRFQSYLADSREMRTILHFWNGIGLALPTLAALTPSHHYVQIVDENYEPVNFDLPCDIVGITSMTQQAARAYEIADAFRERGRHVVIGGIHATVLPSEARQHCDTVFIGEAETSWPAFLQDFCSGNSRAVYSQADYPPVLMSNLPIPRYDLLAKYKYPVVFVQTTRGCPHDCEFCVASNIYGKSYRTKKKAQVLQEIHEAKKHWKWAQIGFADDNMFVSKNYSKSLVASFQKMQFTWFAVCDVSIGRDDSLLSDLHASGCRTLLIGFESLSKSNLLTLNLNSWKAKNLDRYEEYITRIQRHGIAVYGSFILGLDLDTSDTVEQMIRFVTKTNMTGAHATLLTPFPGSKLRLRLEKENRILHSNWQMYTLWNAVIKHPLLSTTQLEEGVMRFFTSIFSKENNQRRIQHFKKICQGLVS